MAVHGDHILAEHYAGAMEPATVHLLISVSKSIVGILGGALAGEGVLTSERVTAYVPARASGYRSATLRHRLDLGSGIAFPRTTWTPTQRSGCSSKPSAGPRRSPYVPNTLRELLLTLRHCARAARAAVRSTIAAARVTSWLVAVTTTSAACGAPSARG